MQSTRRPDHPPKFGTFVTFPLPGVVEAIGWAGYDFAVLDMEHAVSDFAQVADLIRAAEVTGLESLVRIPSGDYAAALRVVEFGATGVLAPHIRTAADAKALVDAIKYAPLGDRGIDPFTRSARYGLRPLDEHIEAANRDVVAMCLIEDQEGVENIDAILSVDGVTGVLLGPADLARSYGVTGNVGHPHVQEAIVRVSDRTLDRGLLLGRAGYDAPTVLAALESGARLITSPAVDAHFIATALSDHLGAIRQAAGIGARSAAGVPSGA